VKLVRPHVPLKIHRKVARQRTEYARLRKAQQAPLKIVYASGFLIGRLRYEFRGEGDAMTCTVIGRFKDDPDQIYSATTPTLRDLQPGIKQKNGKTYILGSPLWNIYPKQQLAYYAVRRWLRRFAPDVCMGIPDARSQGQGTAMKLVRPYVPLKIRCEVIARQLMECGRLQNVLQAAIGGVDLKGRLSFMLACMFGDENVHLDHDPPLCLRHIIDENSGRYDPDANDPRYLIYRTAADHRIKTFVRGDGAQLSDAGKRRKEIGRKRKETPKPNRWPPRGSRPLQWRSR
jgi:hypothetical protein